MENSAKDSFDFERRSGNDRRGQVGLTIRSFIFGGRREIIRRHNHRLKIFVVDRYSTGLFSVIVAILFLSAIDGLFTLFLINHGAYEVNPIMAYYLNLGPYHFFSVKYGLTSLAVFVMLMFRNIFLRSVGIYTHSLFYLILGVFIAVVAWQLYLILYVKGLV